MRKKKSHCEPERRNDFDRTLRHASRQFPSEVARGLLRDRKIAGPVAWTETQVTGRQRRLDRALSLQADQQHTLLHVEWTLRMNKRVKLRTFEYNTLTALALADEARASRKSKEPPLIESVVVVLSGRKKPYPSHGEYRTSPLTQPFSGVHFQIEPVYQRTVAELVERGPFWMIFAPLAVDAGEKKLAQVVKLLRAQTTAHGFKELTVAMGVMVEADRRKRGFRDVVRSLLPKELMMNNWIFNEGKAEGMQPLVHQFERRLERPLTPDERARLAKRLRVDGPEKLGDVVLDLSPAELSAWLAASNGHGK